MSREAGNALIAIFVVVVVYYAWKFLFGKSDTVSKKPDDGADETPAATTGNTPSDTPPPLVIPPDGSTTANGITVASLSAPPQIVAAKKGVTAPRDVLAAELRAREELGLCYFCDEPATHGFPRPEFRREGWTRNDDLARHWRVSDRKRPTLIRVVKRDVTTEEWRDGSDLDARLCADHYRAARMHTATFVSGKNAEHAQFVAGANDAATEYAFQLCEALRAETDRVRFKRGPP